MQRLRLKFGRGTPVRFISHLDSVRCWERVFRRASIPLEYTQGFTPHPRIAVAAPLAVGVTSDAELLDIWLRKWVPPQSALMMARSQLPVGFTLLDAWEVPNGAPALQTMVQTARYECIAMHQIGVAEAQRAAGAFMQAESVVHHFIRGGEEKEVDLRPLVREIVVRAGPNDSCRIDLEVRIGQEGSARPDHVLSELGFVEPAIAIHRAALSFEQSGSDASEDSPRPR